MIDLPFNPDAFGDTMLRAYLMADPGRVPVLANICDRLDDDGRVGDRARFYIVRNGFRREVLRGTLIALGIPLPSWAFEGKAECRANRAFTDAYREQYKKFRRESRQRPSAVPA